MSFPEEREKEDYSVVGVTIHFLFFIGFVSQAVLAIKIIALDKELPSLALCILFAVLFALGYCLTFRHLVKSKKAFIAETILSLLAGIISAILLSCLSGNISQGIGLGLACGALCFFLPMTNRLAYR